MDYYLMSDPFAAKNIRCFTSIGLLVLCVAVLIFIYIFNPASWSIFYPSCPFHALTGLYCPGCGSTRALYQLLHGHPVMAFDLNPFMMMSLPFLGYCLLSFIIAGISGRRLPNANVPTALIWTFLGVILLFWVLRNIPVYPFSLLAPGN